MTKMTMLDCKHRKSKESLGVDSPGRVCNHPFTDDDGDFEDCDHIGEESECPMFEPVAPRPAWGSEHYRSGVKHLGSLFVCGGWHDYWLAPSAPAGKWNVVIRHGLDADDELVYRCDRPGNEVVIQASRLFVFAEALWQSEKARTDKEAAPNA